GNDGFHVLWVDGARCQFVSSGVDEEMNVHDAALLFDGTVGTNNFSGPCRASGLSIGRTSLAAAVPQIEERRFRRLAPNPGPSRLLVAYPGLLRRQGPTDDPVLAARVGQHLIDLVALAIEPSRAMQERTGPEALRAARLATIQADVLKNLSQARLS